MVQTRVLIPVSSSIFVSPPHAGQVCGISILPLFVLFSASCGMIILALYTRPHRRFQLQFFHHTNVVETGSAHSRPSNSTGSKIATGLISPVLDGLHSISVNVCLRCLICPFKCDGISGNLAVLPRFFHMQDHHRETPVHLMENHCSYLLPKIILNFIRSIFCNSTIFYHIKSKTCCPV